MQIADISILFIANVIFNNFGLLFNQCTHIIVHRLEKQNVQMVTAVSDMYGFVTEKKTAMMDLMRIIVAVCFK